MYLSSQLIDRQSGPDQQASSDSRQAILDAAEKLIAERGFAGLSMRELSRQSGLAKSTLYHYFHDKREIYLSVLERDMATFQELLAMAGAVEGDSLTRLRSLIRTYLEYTHQRSSITLYVLRSMGQQDRQVLELFAGHRESILAPFISALQDGVAEGRLRPADIDLMVISLMGMMNGFAAHRLLFECGSMDLELDPEQVTEHTVNLFLRGVLAVADGEAQEQSDFQHRTS